MTFKRMIQAVETHSGEPMRVVTGGVPHICAFSLDGDEAGRCFGFEFRDRFLHGDHRLHRHPVFGSGCLQLLRDSMFSGRQECRPFF